jgi:uncharacterized protein
MSLLLSDQRQMNFESQGSAVTVGNVASVKLSTLRAVADPRSLHLIILPTEKCNFRCSYCYEDFLLGQMSPELIHALNAWIQSRVDDLDSLAISWFGGEPTLALPVVLEVTKSARLALESRSKNFSSHITTNAYRLDRKTFLALTDAGVTSYQISLDGPEQIHNMTRMKVGGGPTFETIWRNLLDIAELAKSGFCDVTVQLRIHYDKKTALSLAPLVDMIINDLLPSGCFNVDFHQIEQLGGSGDDSIQMATSSEHDLIRELAVKVKAASSAGQATVAEDIENYVCYAAKANSFVVRSDGRLGKCTVALNDSRNDIGRLNLDGTIEVFNERFTPWIRGLFTGDSDTLACPLHDLPVA